MADSDIAGLQSATALSPTDVFPVQQGGSSVLKATGAQLRAFTSSIGLFKARNNTGAGCDAIASGVATKLTAASLNVEDVDVSGWYDQANARYTPLVSGWYEIGGSCVVNNLTDQSKYMLFAYKNGGTDQILLSRAAGSGQNAFGLAGIGYIYLNGATDYMEIWVMQQTGSSLSTYAQSAGNLSFFGRLLFAA